MYLIIKNLVALFFLTCLFSPLSSEASSALGEGPLPYRNNFPIYLPFYSFEPDSAYLLSDKGNSLRIEFVYSSIFEVEKYKNPNYYIDMEIAKVRFEFKRKLTNKIQFETDISYLSMGSGFLDSFINSYHEAIGIEVNKQNYPGDNFSYEVEYNGERLRLDGPKNALSDTAFKLKIELLEEDKVYPQVATKVTIKLPTGSSKGLTSDGSIDTGLSLLVSKKFGVILIHLNGSYIRVLNPKLLFAEKGFFQGMGGIEWVWSPQTSLLIQAYYQELPFTWSRDAFSGPTLDGIFGLKHKWRNILWDIGVSEDIIPRGFSPDISLFVGGSYLF